MRSCHRRVRLNLLLACLLCCLSGCGSAPTVSRDGLHGVLTFGSQTLADICVVVHRREGSTFQQLGFGTTNQSGFFYLLKDGGQNPLLLDPGEYAFTLEPLGPQIAFPKEYLQPETSPLKVQWEDGMNSLDLQAPEELLRKLPR